MLHCVSSGRTTIFRHACTLWQSLLPPKVRQLYSPCSLCSLGCRFILHTLPLEPQCKTLFTCLRSVALIQTDVQTDRPHICTHTVICRRTLECYNVPHIWNAYQCVCVVINSRHLLCYTFVANFLQCARHCRVLHDPAHPQCPHTACQVSAVYSSSPCFSAKS